MSLQAVAPENVPGQDGFFPAVPGSQWYLNLKRRGSCKTLLQLLTEDRTLIHALRHEDMTVLHKGVRHGCVELVRFVLVEMFDARGLCTCIRHGAGHPGLTREQLLRKTCSYGSTAVNMAVVSGSPKMVVLLEWAIKMCERWSGQTSQEMSSDEDEDIDEYRTVEAICSICVAITGLTEERQSESTNDTDEITGLDEEVQSESTNDTDNDLPVPEVKDDDLSMLYPSSSEVKSKVVSVIEGVLEDPGDESREWMDRVKKWFVKDVDFEFVPLAHVFLHFIYSISNRRSSLPHIPHNEFNSHRRFSLPHIPHIEFNYFRKGVTKRIFEACADGADGESGAMLTTLFNILDPLGRTLLHCANFESKFLEMSLILSETLKRLGNASASIQAECLNARDGAGRSIFHFMAIHVDVGFYLMEEPHAEVSAFVERLSSPQDQKLDVLKQWCFPLGWDSNLHKLTPLDIAVIVDQRLFFGQFFLTDGSIWRSTWNDERRSNCTSLQLAAMLGRARLIEDMLKYHTKFKSLTDLGLGNAIGWFPPAIHCAAFYGQVEAIQSILKFPIYDPMVQHISYGTALHLLLDKPQIKKMDLNSHHNALLCHVLPNSATYKRVKNDFLKLSCNNDETLRPYSSNEISCINLLLQAGIDIWTPHVVTKELPGPGPMANEEARKWWYEKVVSEVVVLKTNVSYAANATSVVAALVATASFIGPFQPPLGYGDLDGYVRTDRSSLRVYLVCNSFSFYFSIASILMAVLPAIPMPKESLYDELLRSQRCLKGAAVMLLISIICLLISFSSASMAVVSPNWHERGIVVGCVVFGGVLCVIVLAVYMIRLVRMMFHRNDRFRRMFARYMYF